MIVVVCGGRDYTYRQLLFKVLDELHADTPFSLLRHGRCERGADRLADEWARSRGVPVQTFPADWARLGRKAGPIRNAQMLAEHPRPKLAIAFPGGTGTADLVARAHRARIPVVEG